MRGLYTKTRAEYARVQAEVRYISRRFCEISVRIRIVTHPIVGNAMRHMFQGTRFIILHCVLRLGGFDLWKLSHNPQFRSPVALR